MVPPVRPTRPESGLILRLLSIESATSSRSSPRPKPSAPASGAAPPPPWCRPPVVCASTLVGTSRRARRLRSLARRVRELDAEAADHERAIRSVVRSWRPELLDQPGVGPIVAAVALCAWSHPGRIRSEAAFAMLAGSGARSRQLGPDRPPPPQPLRRPSAQPARHSAASDSAPWTVRCRRRMAPSGPGPSLTVRRQTPSVSRASRATLLRSRSGSNRRRTVVRNEATTPSGRVTSSATTMLSSSAVVASIPRFCGPTPSGTTRSTAHSVSRSSRCGMRRSMTWPSRHRWCVSRR